MAAEPSPRGRLLTALIFGALVLLGVLLLWLLLERRAPEPPTRPVLLTQATVSRPPLSL